MATKRSKSHAADETEAPDVIAAAEPPTPEPEVSEAPVVVLEPEPTPLPLPEPEPKKVKPRPTVVETPVVVRPQPGEIVQVRLVGAPQAILIVASGQPTTVIKGESHRARYAHYRQAWQANRKAWEVKYPNAAAFVTEAD